MGGPGTTSVFISSASGHLAAYRRAAIDVCHRIGLWPDVMEEFLPERPAPLDVCRRQIERANAVVLLVGHRLGDKPPGSVASFTEMEYQFALARPELPLHVFVVDPAYPWPPTDVSDGEDKEQLKAFVARLQRAHEIRPFGDLGRFREDLIILLQGYRNAPDDRPDRDAVLPAPPAFHAVPPYVESQPFTGRVTDLGRLDDWATSADPVLVLEAIGGNGKSALTWRWAHDRAPSVIPDLRGRFWWSFYEGSASMVSFLQELAGYLTGRPADEVRSLESADLLGIVVDVLSSQPYLLVLDGFERLLAAYHRFDPTKLRDDEVNSAARSLIDDRARAVVRTLTTCAPSKVLISSRLMPQDLEGRNREPIGGVQVHRLPGLDSHDVVELSRRLGLHGRADRLQTFFDRLGNHPLLIGVVAGLARDYRRAPGDFDRWLDDPAAGGALRLSELDLSQRRTHVLAIALNGLTAERRDLLGWLSVLPGSVQYDTIEEVNPLLPPRPKNPFATSSGSSFLDEWLARRRSADTVPPHSVLTDDPETPGSSDLDERFANAKARYDEELAAWQAEKVTTTAPRLDAALRDIEERGLLWWDRTSNTYDLHPVVRGYVHDELNDDERVRANSRMRDHFAALPAAAVTTPSSVEDLRIPLIIFRALVACRRFAEARSAYAKVATHLRFHLAAFPTILELLQPAARDVGSSALRELGAAYLSTGRVDRAAAVYEHMTEDALKAGEPSMIQGCISVMFTPAAANGQLVAAARYLSLANELSPKESEWAAIYELRRASLDRDMGNLSSLAERIVTLKSLLPPTTLPSFDGDLASLEIYIAWAHGELTEERLNELTKRLFLGIHLPDRAMWWSAYWEQNDRYDLALQYAEDSLRLCRGRGLSTTFSEASVARILIQLGETTSARRVVEDVLMTLDRVAPGLRPYGVLADSLERLGEDENIADLAIDAYKVAWANGPPFAFDANLRAAQERLDRLRIPHPSLPTIDPETFTAPLEREIRAFIAAHLAKSPVPTNWPGLWEAGAP